MPETNEPDFEFESQKLLRGLEDELNAVEEEFRQQSHQITAIEEEERELRIKLDALAKRKREFDVSTFDIKRKIRTLKNSAIPDAIARVEIDRRNVENSKQIAAQAQYFDLITADCLWQGKLYPHQVEGSNFLAIAKRAICADVMGLGKTIQAVATLDKLQSKRVLVICPGDVVGNFIKEFAKWSTRPVINAARQPKAMQQTIFKQAAPVTPGVVVVINYEAWYQNRNILTWIVEAGFDTVILDEAHAIKETNKAPYMGAERIVLAHNKCEQCEHIFQQGTRVCPVHKVNEHGRPSVENFIAMTGTPILNRPGELFSLLHLVDYQIFNDRGRYNRLFTDGMGETWAKGGQEALAKEIAGFYIGRDYKDAGVKLPPQEVIIHEIELDPVEYSLQAEIIKTLRQEAQIKMEGEATVSITEALALITRSRQAEVWPGGIWVNRNVLDEFGQPVIEFNYETEEFEVKQERYWIGQHYQQSCKLDKAVELYNELIENGHRVVFFSQFKEALNEMKRRLGEDVAVFTGDTSQSERELIKQNFDASVGETPKWKGVLCHYKTGGVGLNLTAATAMIILDEEWNEGKEEQAFRRINRIGQENETQVHILRRVGEGSMDVWLAGLIEEKSKIVSGFKLSIDRLKGAFE